MATRWIGTLGRTRTQIALRRLALALLIGTGVGTVAFDEPRWSTIFLAAGSLLVLVVNIWSYGPNPRRPPARVTSRDQR